MKQNDEEADCLDCGRPLIRAGMFLCDTVIDKVTRDGEIKEFRCKKCSKKKVKK